MADTNLPDLGEIGPLKSEPAVLNDLSEIKQESIKQESDDNCDSGVSGVSVTKDSIKSVKEGAMVNDYPEPSLDADGKPRPSINKLPDITENDKSPFDTASAGTNFDSSNGMPCSGEDVPKDTKRCEIFEETSTSEITMNGLNQSKLENPTPIKEDDMKSVKDGKDEMDCAPTNFDSFDEIKCSDESNQKSKPNGLGQESGEIGSHESVANEHSIKNSSERSLDADEKPISPIDNPPDLTENDKSLFTSASADQKFDSSNGMPYSVSGEDVPKDEQKWETFEETSTSETIMSGLNQSKVESPTPKQEDDMKSAMGGKDEMACEQANFDSFDEMKCFDETKQDSKPDVSLQDPASESNEQGNSLGSGGDHSPSETKLKSDESRQESGDAWGSVGECPSEGGGSGAENTSKSKSNENDPWSSQSGSNDTGKSGSGGGWDDPSPIETKPKLKSDDLKQESGDGGWGDPSPSETKPKSKSNESKQESGDGGWGDLSPSETKPKLKSDDLKQESGDGGWGDPTPDETKPKSKSNESKQESGDACGSTGGWGDPSPPANKPKFKSDEPKQQSDDAWGSSGGWGNPTPSETKPKFKSDDSKQESGDAWGATGGGWGDPSPPKNKPKQQSDDAWGSSGGWGNPTPSETKPNSRSNDSKQESGDAWGATGGEWSSGGGSSWADAGSSSKKSGGDDWGASSGTSDWGAPSGTSDRGRSGGSGGKGCFKCGEEGHMSRECPKGGGSGSRGKGCFKCGEEGHMSRECPSGGGSGTRGKGCFKCGEEGHMSRECPTGGGSSRGGGGRACFKCGEEGHMSRECPSGGGSSRGGSGKGCFKCGEEGHMSRECPNGGREGRDRRAVKSEGAPWGSSGGDWGSDDCAASPAKKNCNWESSSGSTAKNSKEDSWGASGGGWGDPSPSETKPKFKSSDSKQDSSDTWGGGWGDPSPSETKPNSKSNDSKQESGDPWGSGGGSSWGDSGSSPKKSGGSDWGTSSGTSDRGKSGGSGGKGCFKCGEEGHMSRECPKGGGSGSRGKGCHKCGKEGHMAKDCTEPSLDADGKPRPPVYRPADLNENDESLYDTAEAGENFDSYDGMPCSVSGVDVPKDPERYETFEEAFTSETILNGLKRSKIIKPTPIQKYGMRIVMAGRDLMACAQTGSGKTLAFILPILQELFNDKDLRSGYGEIPAKPKALIISPTRELAVQIYKETYKYSRGSIVKVQIIYGGTSVGHQKAKLSEGAHILVGTAGRLLDFLDKNFYDFSELKYLVLDEADRMIDQGFIPDVRKMIVHPTMPPKEKRQTLMFSATFANRVQKVAAEFLVSNYLFLTVGILGAANSDVHQTLLKVEKFSKRNKLLEILKESNNNDRTMVFVESKKTADFLASFLSQSDFKATSIHGDRYQRQREEALDDLKSGKFPILVATSVASRGLDIKDVRHVINYDLPKEIDDYIHRIGRTGRVGNKGKATSFYDPDADKDLAPKIVEVIKSAQQPVPDWLTEETSEGQFGSDIAFGGVDYRGGEGGNASYEDLDAPKKESGIDLEW